MPLRRFGIALSFVLLAACAHHEDAPKATPPPMLIDERGTSMPFEKAVTHVVFRPYVPAGQILGYAVLPPLGDLDTDAHRGLGIEYVTANRAMLLSQWPKQDFTIAFAHTMGQIRTCTLAHYKADGAAWLTSSNVVMTLQPDGSVSPAVVDDEARRLMRAGACR
ncbi:MAG TPA: hypothetical protein VK760_11425 [Candidatus Acidoferrales bacterium]|jgi:hypothetical protein|nr:hypothetical protein [Candidatus Acidoferrales bacterium]